MEFYNDMTVGLFLVVLFAYIFAGGLVAKFHGHNLVDQQEYLRCVIFWPYYLVRRPVKAFWRHIRSPKPPNRTKA